MSGPRHFTVSVLLAVFLRRYALATGRSSTSVFDFSYDHAGEDWLIGECASRDRQSPINLGREAPWSCAPPLFPFLRKTLGDKLFFQRGFAKLARAEGFAVGGGLAGAPGPSPAASAAAPSPAAMLEVGEEVSEGSQSEAGMFAGCNGNIGAFFFKYDMAEKPMTIQNNGHAISTDLKGHGLGGIIWDEAVYDVLSVNFHVYSEHRYNGKQLPLELHIVHRQPETDHIIVVAVPFDTTPATVISQEKGFEAAPASLLQGKHAKLQRARGSRSVFRHQRLQDPADDAEAPSILPDSSDGALPEPQPTDPGFSDALANLMVYPLPLDGETKSVPLREGPVDVLAPLLGGKGIMPEAFFKYEGSLTAPPCTEQVTWLVRKEPLIASKSQIELFRVAIMQANSNYPNSRSPMPLMGRGINFYLGIHGEAPPPPPHPIRLGSGAPERVSDFRGVALGKEAVQRALEAAQAKNQITVAVTQAQQVWAAMASSVDPAVAAGTQAQVAASAAMITTPLPTPNPEKVLSRIVDAVADQMDGAEKAAAMAAAGVAYAAPAPAVAIR